MNNFQIDFQRNSRFIKAALISRIFDKKYIYTTLKSLWILGILCYAFVLIDILDIISIDSIIAFKTFGFIGICSFIFYVFLRTYLRETELDEAIIIGRNSYNIYSISDFGLINILIKLDFNSPDIDKLFSALLKMPRVRFIISELGMSIDQFLLIKNNYQSFVPKNALNSIFEIAINNAIEESESKITSADVFFGFIMMMNDTTKFSTAMEIEKSDIKNVIFWANSLFNKMKYPITLIQKFKTGVIGLGEDWAYGYTLYLDTYSTNVQGPRFFDDSYAVGRKQTISQLETILSKQSNNNCLLVGDLGCGKKTVVYSLASKLFSSETTKELRHNRIVQLNVESLLAGASNNQDIEERLLLVFQDAAHAGNVIIFINDIHVLFQGGNKVGSIDATEVINPYLQSGQVRVIGTTNSRDFDTYLAPKTAVLGMFEKIDIKPTNKDETIQVLEDLSLFYSQKYNVRITYNALREVYNVADQYISDKVFPRKAIDLIENILASAQRDGQTVLDNHLVSKMSQVILSIPVGGVSSDEKDSLLSLEGTMHKRVVSQDDAISAVVNALKRKRAQVHDSARPIGVFLFLGPTGVGKTEVAKTLAESYFGDEKAVIRMDMNQFQNSLSIKQFLGQKQPGLDELEGGHLVKEIKQKPFSVILLDELEKAHKDILNIFLQIFDEGYTKDGMGDTVKFSNSIIIATSNAAANMIREGVSSGVDWSMLKENVFEHLQKEGIFTPEFINRFDEVIMFKPLTEENLREISLNIINSMISDFEKKGYLIEVDAGVIDLLIKKGYQPEFGARPLKRAIQDTLENYLADKIIKDEIIKGEKFVVKKEDL